MKERNTKLYSYKGSEPDYLPFDKLSDDGETLMKGIFYLEDSKLYEIGYEGPYEKPRYDSDKEKLVWENKKYTIVPLSELEIEFLKTEKIQKDIEERKGDIKYDQFYNLLLDTSFFKKVRYNSLKSSDNILTYNEFLFSFLDIKLNNKSSPLFDNCLKIFFSTIDLNDEDLLEFENLAKSTNIDTIISIPKREEIDRTYFDIKNYKFISKPPFKSWIFDGEKFNPPTPYPKDGKRYLWDEEKESWIESTS